MHTYVSSPVAGRTVGVSSVMSQGCFGVINRPPLSRGPCGAGAQLGYTSRCLVTAGIRCGVESQLGFFVVSPFGGLVLSHTKYFGVWC